MAAFLRLGVNVDHVATIRNARGGNHPDPVQAALLAAKAGADGITAHLREDRRHISDRDIERLMAEIGIPLNLEMAATDEMLAIALRHGPNAACIVPEKRQERTTEGGLDAAGGHNQLAPFVGALGDGGIRVSLFVEPESRQLDAALSLSAPAVELHTGAYADANPDAHAIELEKITQAARYGSSIGLTVHAGHGLHYGNVQKIAALREISELNIGHSIVAQAVFVGLAQAVNDMKKAMLEARRP